MNRTKIDWADYSWNPIKGLCPEGCWYCYGRRIYQRFRLDPSVRWANDYLRAYRIPAGSKVFVCSTMEIFHPNVPKSWRDSIFKDIEKHPGLTFIVLTKRPERIDRVMPANVWLGVSLEGWSPADQERVEALTRADAMCRFVSIEPFLGSTPQVELYGEVDWVIVGRLTGHGRKHDPELAALQYLVLEASGLDIPIFMKNNLKGIWPGPLIQEYPAGERRKG